MAYCLRRQKTRTFTFVPDESRWYLIRAVNIAAELWAKTMAHMFRTVLRLGLVLNNNSLGESGCGSAPETTCGKRRLSMLIAESCIEGVAEASVVYITFGRDGRRLMCED